MAHKVPKDIDLIIYRFIHRDLTKLVNQEYHKKVKACTCKEYYDCKNDICYSCIHVKLRYVVAFNYRSLRIRYYSHNFIYNIYGRTTKKALPENY